MPFGAPTFTYVQLKALSRVRTHIASMHGFRSIGNEVEAEYEFKQAELWAAKLPPSIAKQELSK